MTKTASNARTSSSIPSYTGGGKRAKRPRSDNNNHRSSDTTTRDSDDDSQERKQQQSSSQRLYHGVCPDVSNRYRKVGGGRIGQGTYGVVYCARDVWKQRQQQQQQASSGSSDKQKPPIRKKETKTNDIVALKKCYAHHEASDGFPITTLREIHALRICSSHPNIVDLLEIAVSSNGNKNSSKSGSSKNGGEKDDKENTKDVTQTSTIKIGKSNVFLVFEHCRYDLAHILDSYHEHQRKTHHRSRGSFSSPFSLAQTKILVLQLLSALEFCHLHWLVHRDIKPSNLLYDTTTGRLKLCDFGLSRIAVHSDAHMTPNVVSLWYRAPELLLSGKHQRIRYSFPIDMWATGCLVAELFQGTPLLDGSSEMEQLEKMQDSLGPPPSSLYDELPARHNKRHSMGLWDRFEYLVPPEGLTLLTRLLDYDPETRWKAAEASKSDFLARDSKPAPIEDLRAMPRSFPGC